MVSQLNILFKCILTFYQPFLLKGHSQISYCNSQAASATTTATGSAPMVVSQPKPTIEAIVGQPMQLTISVRGTPPITYTWYKDTRELVFAKGNVLSLPSVSFSDGGRYCCAISNRYGSILSNGFVISVKKKAPLSGEAIENVQFSLLDIPYNRLFMHPRNSCVLAQKAYFKCM